MGRPYRMLALLVLWQCLLIISCSARPEKSSWPSWIFESPEEGLQPTSNGSGRLIFPSYFCGTSSTDPTGECMQFYKCLATGGSFDYTSSCPGLPGASCCKYTVGCNAVVKSRVAFWQNQGYPGTTSGPSSCTLVVVPRKDTCFIRVQFLDTLLTASTVDNCDGNTLTIDNQAEGDSSLICSSLVNYETIVRVRTTNIKFNIYSVDDLRLVLRIRDTNFRYNIKISQVQCAQINGVAGGVSGIFGRSLNSNSAKTHLNEIVATENDIKKGKPHKNMYVQPLGHNNTSKINKEREISIGTKDFEGIGLEPRITLDEDEESLVNTTINVSELTRLANEAGLRDDGDTVFVRDLCEVAKLDAVQRIALIGTTVNNRILAGSAPYFGTVMVRNQVGDTFFCGSTLIAPTYVLTAASCLLRQGYDSNMYEIRVFFNLLNDLGTPVARTYEVLWARDTRYDVKRVVFHPMYDHNNYHYDIAVIELTTAVTGNSPINLAEPGNLYENVEVTEMGHGIRSMRLSYNANSYNRHALFVTGTTLSTANCQAAYSAALNRHTTYNGQFIKDEMICMEAGDGHQVCEGDQGGPVVTGFNGGSPVLVGIISGNLDNCIFQGYSDVRSVAGQYPDIAVRITSVLDFINAATTNIEYDFGSTWNFFDLFRYLLTGT